MSLKKTKSVQSASYSFILLDVPIEIHSECKAFIEIGSLTEVLIWVSYVIYLLAMSPPCTVVDLL